MLFNSPAFIFGFLPLALASFFLAARFLGRNAALGALVLAALVFYGNWQAWHIVVLAVSIGANYLLAGRIIATRERDERRSRAWLISAITANLLVLGLFKYFDFFAEVISAAPGLEVGKLGLGLPLGISFFTFTQITYLVDGFKGRAERVSLLRYMVFVTYFPHLIAGPILHHSEILPQFERPEPYRFDRIALLDGMTLFLCGLAKKTLLADEFGLFARDAFIGAQAGEPVSFFAAWGAALSYAFQIYFDFSGYSDMALGAARMMKIELPVNFLSPYKATNISVFWRRWHMTLSRFLRDYIYIPLGGSRRGEGARYRNLMIVMLLGGFWHGAGWTFIAWGGLHGLYLVAHHALGERLRLPRAVGWMLTFLGVTIAWVLFRADSLGAAAEIYKGMAGLSGFLVPNQVSQFLPGGSLLFGDVPSVPMLADGGVLGFVGMSVMLAAGLAICLAAPNLYEMSLKRRIILAGLLVPFLIHAVLFALGASEFIYFRF